jgi:flagellar M-ring protein FliF
MALRLSTVPAQGALAEGDALLAPPVGSFYAPALTGPSQVAADGSVSMLNDESMVNMSNVEGQLRASSIRKLADMVDKHPEESLTIMRGWMSAEQN